MSSQSSDMNWSQWPIKHLLLLFKACSSFAKSLIVQAVVAEPRNRIPAPPETQPRTASCVLLFSHSVLLQSLAYSVTRNQEIKKQHNLLFGMHTYVCVCVCVCVIFQFLVVL